MQIKVGLRYFDVIRKNIYYTTKISQYTVLYVKEYNL